MQLGIKTKFVLLLSIFGVAIVATSAVVHYVAYGQFTRHRMEVELSDEALEFAQNIHIRGDSVVIDPTSEWDELEHVKDAEYARYVQIVDSGFQTLEKSANLGVREFQPFVNFLSSIHLQSQAFTMDSIEYLAVCHPVVEQGRPMAYVVTAGRYGILVRDSKVFGQTIWVSFLIIVVVGTASAWILGHRVIRPLTAIQHITGDITLDSLNQRISVPSSEIEIQNLTESINRLLERLETSFQKINEFSSNVSHELRTPLTILRGNIEVALAMERQPEEYVELLSSLLEETIHITEIVDQLLLLARADAHSLIIDRHPIDLSAWCLNVSKDWESLCAIHNQRLDYTGSDGLWIEGEPNLLYQPSMNIISNASKYSGPGQRIEVRLNSIRLKDGQTAVEFRIKDEGIGIPESALPHVFERFYRVNQDRSRQTGGTGLGLSIARMICELHGGEIHIDSVMSIGTTVTIIMPSIDPPPASLSLVKGAEPEWQTK